MVRKKLTPEEERQLAQEIEASRGDPAAWDFSRPKRLAAGPNLSFVISARVSYDQAKALRDIAERENLSLSDVTKQAIDVFIAASGPSLYKSERASGNWTFYLRDAPVTETLQPGDQQIRNDEPGFARPDTDDTTAQ